MSVLFQKFGFVLVLICAACPMVGCSNDVAEIDTPSGEIEVEEELDGDLEAEFED